LKILITSFTYPPNKDGVSEATRSMAEGYASMGHEVSVATSHHPKREIGIINGVKVTSFNLSNSGVWIDPSGDESDRFIQFVKNTNPDILINHCWDAWPAVLSQKIFNDLTCKKIQISHGFSQHIWTPHCKPFFGLGQLLKGLLWTVFKFPGVAKSYDAVVFLSNCRGFGRFLDQTICRWMGHPGMHVIPNNVDVLNTCESMREFRGRYGIGSGPMILCVANYCDRKNQKLAVRAFRKADIPRSSLVFIGSEFNDYSQAVMKSDRVLSTGALCHTIFLQGISRKETMEALAESDIFLLTAKQETQPIVIIEAMAATKPWISTPTGCVSDMEGGIVAKGCDKISEAITDLSKNPQARIQLGRQGRDAVLEKYDRRNAIESWTDLISSIR
jgi:glycosyltransferase involved in cell wall biosynthesis